MADAVNLDTKFSAADQTLAFTLCWFATDRTMSEKDHKLYAGILGDVLPFVTEDHPIVAPMVEISKQIVGTIENGGSLSMWMHFDASNAVRKFAAWRAGRSHEVFQQQRGAVS